jgi:serine/threonine-protein kinase/endoribonuclease IRE1
MNRDPREMPLVMLETGAQQVVGNDWHSRLDRTFIDNLGKFRKYDGRSVQDLMRALRNKVSDSTPRQMSHLTSNQKHHYQDLPENVKRNLGSLPEGFLMYFTHRFPALFLHVYYVVSSCGLAQESMFQSYFELVDT